MLDVGSGGGGGMLLTDTGGLFMDCGCDTCGIWIVAAVVGAVVTVTEVCCTTWLT